MSVHPGIRAFCDTIGVAPRRMPVVLDFERTGQVRFEASRGWVAVSLKRDLPRWRTGVLAAALRAVHHQYGTPYPVQVCCPGGDALKFVLRLPDEAVDPPTLDSAVRLLARLATEAESSA
jgi:type III secretion system chaperone SycN